MKAFIKEVKVDGSTVPENPQIMVTVKYSVEGVEGYFNNTYLEERTFKQGEGMIGFRNLMKAEIKAID